MEKRLKNYLAWMENLRTQGFTVQEKEELRREVLVQIQFFQHERLVHLIVTVTFAILQVLLSIRSMEIG